MEMMALNAYAPMEMMALNAYAPMEMMALNAYGNGGFECLCNWWLWTPMEVVALNAYESGEEKFDNLYTRDMTQCDDL